MARRLKHLKKKNLKKLIASERVGLNLFAPQILEELDHEYAMIRPILEQAYEETKDNLDAFGSSCGFVACATPLPSLTMFVEFKERDGVYSPEKYGFKSGQSSQVVVGGEEYQVPSLVIRILHDDWRNESISCPLGFIFDNPKSFDDATVIYEHRYWAPMVLNPIEISPDPTNLVYVGLTRRNWATRWREHLNAAKRGSSYDFHTAIRQFHGKFHSTHRILAVCQYEEDALSWEEYFVDSVALRPKGLNMIPGGKKGLQFARRYRPHTSLSDWERKERVVADIAAIASKAGRKNPVQSLRLLNEGDYMKKLVLSRESTFSENDIVTIRTLSEVGYSETEIAKRIGCKDPRRVSRVVCGITYKFV